MTSDVPAPDVGDDLPETVPDADAQATDDDSSPPRPPDPSVPYGTPGDPLGPGAGG